MPLKNNTYHTRSTHSVGPYFSRTNTFKYSFFPYTFRELDKLDLQLRNGKFLKNSEILYLKLVDLLLT